MKPVSLLMAIVGSSSLLMLTALPIQAADSTVKVNGKTISQEMIDAYAEIRARGGAPATGTPEEKQQILDEVINLEIFSQAAEKEGLDKKPNVIAQLDLQKNRLLANMVIGEYLQKNPIKEESLKETYDKEIAGGSGKEYKARHILVKTEQEAKDIIKELDAGKDFATIAKAKSTDTGSGAKGGDLGWFPLEQMVKPFSDAVAKQEKGKVSKTPIKTDFGWHIIIVDDSRAATPPPFDQVKDQIRQKLTRDVVEAYVMKARATAKIEK